jgi:hypothetical protein
VKPLRLLSILIALFAILPFAHAQTGQSASITCDAPTKYTDGLSIPAGTAITFTLYGGLKGATKSPLATSPTCKFVRSNLAAGEQQWYVTAGASYMGSPVLESPPSAIVIKVIETGGPLDTDGDGVPDTADACPAVKGTLANGCNPSPPAPPVNVTVETLTAYEYRPSTKTMAAIGLVPEATACGPEVLLLNSLTYCRVKLADSLPVVWPANRKIREVWVVKPVG